MANFLLYLNVKNFRNFLENDLKHFDFSSYNVMCLNKCVIKNVTCKIKMSCVMSLKMCHVKLKSLVS